MTSRKSLPGDSKISLKEIRAKLQEGKYPYPNGALSFKSHLYAIERTGTRQLTVDMVGDRFLNDYLAVNP